MLHEAFIPHVKTMLLLPVVLLSVLQGSVTKTVKTVVPQYTLERSICQGLIAEYTQASSIFGCAAQLINTNYHGFWFLADTGTCKFFTEPSEYKTPCWKLV